MFLLLSWLNGYSDYSYLPVVAAVVVVAVAEEAAVFSCSPPGGSDSL